MVVSYDLTIQSDLYYINKCIVWVSSIIYNLQANKYNVRGKVEISQRDLLTQL